MANKEQEVVIFSRTIEAGNWPDIQGFIQDMIKLGTKVKVIISVPEEEEGSGEEAKASKR